ncbi:MAG TPA: hypothetical protein VLL95_00535 [Phnomibacter sp.]|nr:hypothetical protein [Phnomibacter sp.]
MAKTLLQLSFTLKQSGGNDTDGCAQSDKESYFAQLSVQFQIPALHKDGLHEKQDYPSEYKHCMQVNGVGPGLRTRKQGVNESFGKSNQNSPDANQRKKYKE